MRTADKITIAVFVLACVVLLVEFAALDIALDRLDAQITDLRDTLAAPGSASRSR